MPASKIKGRRGTKISPIKGSELIAEDGTLIKSIDKGVAESRTKSVKGLHKPSRVLQSPEKMGAHNDSVVIINNNNSPGAQSIQNQYE